MIVVTTNNIEGGTIKRYIDSVCANTVVGTNLFSDISASFVDFFGGRSGSYKRKLESIYEAARNELEIKASRIGANAIIGFRVDFDEISGKDKSMLMVSASGTACVVEYDKNPYSSEIESVDMFSVDEEMEKMDVVELLKAGRPLKQRWAEILIKLHPSEAITPLITLYLRYVGNASDSSLEEIEGILSSYPKGAVEPYVYKEYVNAGYSNILCKLIINSHLFDAGHILSICKADIHAGIKLLESKRESYSSADLAAMKNICTYIDSLPDTGRIEKVKVGLLKKEEEMFICENGHKSKKDSEFCENANCRVNIKGITSEESILIEKFKKRIYVIEKLLSLMKNR